MFYIDIPQEIKIKAYDHLKTTKIGNRPSGANGSFKDQYSGLMSEAALKYAITGDMDYATDFGHGSDGGTDIIVRGTKCDLKTRSSYTSQVPKPFWEMSILEEQVNTLNTDVYIIGMLYKDTTNRDNTKLCISGYLTKEQVKQQKYVRKGDMITLSDGQSFPEKANAYKIYFKDINPLTSIDQLK